MSVIAIRVRVVWMLLASGLAAGCAEQPPEQRLVPPGATPEVEAWMQHALAMHEAAEEEAERTNPTGEDLTAAWYPMPEWPAETMPPVDIEEVAPAPFPQLPADTVWEEPAPRELCRTGVDPPPTDEVITATVMEPPGQGDAVVGPMTGLHAQHDGPLTDINPDPEWAAAVIAQVDERLAVLEREVAPEGGWSDQERYAQKLALWDEYERE